MLGRRGPGRGRLVRHDTGAHGVAVEAPLRGRDEATGGATDTSRAAEVRSEAAVRGRHEGRRGHAPVGDAALFGATVRPARPGNPRQAPAGAPHPAAAAAAAHRRRVAAAADHARAAAPAQGRDGPRPAHDRTHGGGGAVGPLLRVLPGFAAGRRAVSRAPGDVQALQRDEHRRAAPAPQRAGRAAAAQEVPRVHGPQDAHPELRHGRRGDRGVLGARDTRRRGLGVPRRRPQAQGLRRRRGEN